MAVAKLTQARAAAAADTLADAFASDPLWSWMLAEAPDPGAARRHIMAILVAGGLVNDAVWSAGEEDSIQIWTPAGCREITEAQEDELIDYIKAQGAETAGRMLPTFEVFERARAEQPTNNYLGVFGTRSALKGTGVGGTVMRAAFEYFAGDDLPCYLESSNPANEPMYQHLGFEPLGHLELAEGTPPVRMMRRD